MFALVDISESELPGFAKGAPDEGLHFQISRNVFVSQYLNMRNVFPSLLLLLTTSICLAEPKPVPRMQAIPQPYDQVSIQRDGVEVTRLHFGKDLNRPFLFPVIGPSGRSLTRMGHPHDPVTHSHHNSIWVSHNDVAGENFWADGSGARIVQQRIIRLEDSEQEAFVETEHLWKGKDGTPILRELRRTAVQPLDGGEWLLVLDLQFSTVQDKEVTLGQTAFGLVGVRMAKTIGVHDGGGTIRNSEGGIDEEGCFRKPARWCDYAGPITASASEGITLMDHPMNANHPVPFHVRNDGWMGASLTFPGPLTIKPGEPLKLRYAAYVHSGIPEAGAIQKQWEAFAATAFREFPTKR